MGTGSVGAVIDTSENDAQITSYEGHFFSIPVFGHNDFDCRFLGRLVGCLLIRIVAAHHHRGSNDAEYGAAKSACSSS